MRRRRRCLRYTECVHPAMCAVFVTIGVSATAGLATPFAKDWPQWRGAERRGLWTETGILKEFPDAGLTVKWRVSINGGYSGPAVADGRVFVLDYVETEWLSHRSLRS